MSDDFVEIQFVGFNAVLAQWNCATDLVEINWPKVEEVADTLDNPLRGLAKILLAARDAGRNDPLPGFVE